MPAERDIMIVSDLHIGDGGPRDNFAADNKVEKFSCFLDYVAGQQAELMILGDLFEFWQANIGRVLTRHLSLIERLAAMQAVVGSERGFSPNGQEQISQRSLRTRHSNGWRQCRRSMSLATMMRISRT